jgi:uncharacterized beta-barrel protein YwiB (DUF1934 family)
MTNTPTTWLNTVKALFKEKGKGTSMKTVLPLAKKEWDLIKSGKHPTKMQAVKGTTSKRSRRKSKSSKKSKTSRKKRKSKKRRRNR